MGYSFVLILLATLLIGGFFFIFIKGRKGEDGNLYTRTKRYLEEETEKREKELKEESDFDDFELSEDAIFLLVGLLATCLFVVCGLFTGNKMYPFLGLFLITAVAFIVFLLPKDKM